MKKYLSGLFFVLLFVSAQGCKKKSNVIAIGVAGPITGSQAQTGNDMVDGARLAVMQVNKQGGINGKKIKLIVRDDKADPKEAANVAMYMVAHPEVKAVVGHLNSDCSLRAARIYSLHHMAMVTPVSTSDALTSKGYKNVFRIPIRNSLQGSEAARFILKKGYKHIAVLDDGGAYGAGLAEQFMKVMKETGHQSLVVLKERYSKEDTDFRPLIQKLKAKGVDVVFFGGMYPSAGIFMKQASSLGVTFDLVGGDGLFAPKLIELGGKALNGHTFVTFIAPLPSDLKHAPKFYTDFKKQFGHLPIVYSPLAYDAAMVIITAMKTLAKEGKPITREGIIEVLHRKDFSYNGVTGKIRFDKNGDIIGRRPYFYEVKNGKFVLIQDQ